MFVLVNDDVKTTENDLKEIRILLELLAEDTTHGEEELET